VERLAVTIFAAIRPEKNHEMLLAGAGRIMRRSRDLLFLIVGEEKKAKKLQRIAEHLLLGTGVRFLSRRAGSGRKSWNSIVRRSDARLCGRQNTIELCGIIE
jgi:hypothetical protein